MWTGEDSPTNAGAGPCGRAVHPATHTITMTQNERIKERRDRID
jgi:hypothetical protein